MRTAGVLIASAMAMTAWGCGGESSAGTEPAVGPTDASASDRVLTIKEYLALKTDALTSDKIDWKEAMEIARKRVTAEPDAEDYYVEFPVQWFNAEYDVMIYAYRRKDDREIVKGPGRRGFAVVLDASTGAVKVAGKYERE